MVRIKALRDCKFVHESQSYRFDIGEEREVDVPIERIDPNSFEILGEERKEKYGKKRTNSLE